MVGILYTLKNKLCCARNRFVSIVRVKRNVWHFYYGKVICAQVKKSNMCNIFIYKKPANKNNT